MKGRTGQSQDHRRSNKIKQDRCNVQLPSISLQQSLPIRGEMCESCTSQAGLQLNCQTNTLDVWRQKNSLCFSIFRQDCKHCKMICWTFSLCDSVKLPQPVTHTCRNTRKHNSKSVGMICRHAITCKCHVPLLQRWSAERSTATDGKAKVHAVAANLLGRPVRHMQPSSGFMRAHAGLFWSKPVSEIQLK